MIFDNGATRARVQACAVGLLFGVGWAATVLVTRDLPAWRWPVLSPLLALGLWLALVRLSPPKIPVLNYHSVSAQPDWLQIADQVSVTPAAFERQLAYLKQHGYKSLFISEAHGLLAGETPTTGRCVALTFDDGYADNWIAVLPLLKKYGMKATMFVSTDFIAEAERCRPTIEHVPEDELDWSGYLTWPELKAMQSSGLVEIQSHGRSHTRVFSGTELRGFVGPGKPNLWMLWNARPESRTTWWRELDEDQSLWGQPVFPQAPALASRAYDPDQGAWESDEEYERRIEGELIESRRTLESELGAKVDMLCWPENAFSDAGEKIARRLGYAATVSNRHTSRNAVGEAPDRIVRVFIGSHVLGVAHPFWDFVGFVLELKVFEGWYVAYPLLAVMHAAKKAAFAVRKRSRCHKDYLSSWA